MLDPNFRRAVLFIAAHTAGDGAVGVILNRPLEKQVSEVVTETPLNALEKVPVFFGGPVGRDRPVRQKILALSPRRSAAFPLPLRSPVFRAADSKSRRPRHHRRCEPQ